MVKFTIKRPNKIYPITIALVVIEGKEKHLIYGALGWVLFCADLNIPNCHWQEIPESVFTDLKEKLGLIKEEVIQLGKCKNHKDFVMACSAIGIGLLDKPSDS